jgi:hypothetical protein
MIIACLRLAMSIAIKIRNYQVSYARALLVSVVDVEMMPLKN